MEKYYCNSKVFDIGKSKAIILNKNIVELLKIKKGDLVFYVIEDIKELKKGNKKRG